LQIANVAIFWSHNKYHVYLRTISDPRDSGEGPSQCNRNQKNSKCECCCTESMCNAGLCPYNFTRKFWFVSVQHASITPK